MLLVLAFVAGTVSAPVRAAATPTYGFNGVVGKPYERFARHAVALSVPATLSAVLEWSEVAADLDLQLKDPTGATVASARTSDRPETLTFDALATGTWTVVVRARSGTSAYSLTVALVPLDQSPAIGGVATEPSAGPTVEPTVQPTAEPTVEPTVQPTVQPTAEPTMPVANTPPAVSAGILRPWAPENEAATHSTTADDALADASEFDLIVALRSTYRSYVGAMMQADPGLRLLAYMNGSFAQKGEATAYPESWYARDAQGAKIQSTGWGNYLMDVSNPAWIANRADTCASFIAYSGYQGCMLDMLGVAPLLPGYLTSLPIDPATGKVWAQSEWLAATAALATQVRAAVSPHVVFGNGLGNGRRYFGSPASAQLLSGLDGGIAEAWIRSAGQGIGTFPTEAYWKQDVDMLADAAARGKAVLTLTKVWVEGTTAQKDAWHEFALASFLLGSNGSSYFSFSYDRGDDPTAGHPWDDVDLGDPIGPYAKADGVYQRAFTAGKVLVNPTRNTYVVALDRPYRTLEGTVVTSVTIGPDTGVVLVAA